MVQAKETGTVDYDDLEAKVLAEAQNDYLRASAYSRDWDYAQ